MSDLKKAPNVLKKYNDASMNDFVMPEEEIKESDPQEVGYRGPKKVENFLPDEDKLEGKQKQRGRKEVFSELESIANEQSDPQDYKPTVQVKTKKRKSFKAGRVSPRKKDFLENPYNSGPENPPPQGNQLHTTNMSQLNTLSNMDDSFFEARMANIMTADPTMTVKAKPSHRPQANVTLSIENLIQEEIKQSEVDP